jgi:hypothetical protein
VPVAILSNLVSWLYGISRFKAVEAIGLGYFDDVSFEQFHIGTLTGFVLLLY